MKIESNAVDLPWISLLCNQSLEMVFYLGALEKTNEGAVG